MMEGGRPVAEWRLQVTYFSGVTKILRRSRNYDTLNKRMRIVERQNTRNMYAVVPHRYQGSSEYENCGYDTARQPVYAINHEDFTKPMKEG